MEKTLFTLEKLHSKCQEKSYFYSLVRNLGKSGNWMKSGYTFKILVRGVDAAIKQV